MPATVPPRNSACASLSMTHGTGDEGGRPAADGHVTDVHDGHPTIIGAGRRGPAPARPYRRRG